MAPAKISKECKAVYSEIMKYRIFKLITGILSFALLWQLFNFNQDNLQKSEFLKPQTGWIQINALRQIAFNERAAIADYVDELDVDPEIMNLLRTYGWRRELLRDYERIESLLVFYNSDDPAQRLTLGFRFDARGEMAADICKMFLFVPPLNRFVEVHPRGVYSIQKRIAYIRPDLVEVKSNDTGVNKPSLLTDTVESSWFWTHWHTKERRWYIERQRGGVGDISDWEYERAIDPVCAKRIKPLLERLYGTFGEVSLLDICAGAGNFVDIVLREARGQYSMTSALIERDAVNVATAREVLLNRGTVVIEAGLGVNSAGVWAQLPKRPNIVTSIGGINHKVMSREDAFATARQVYDILPLGGIFVVSGLSVCHLDRDDFEAIGFRVECMTIPGNILEGYPFQFYVLVKHDPRPSRPDKTEAESILSSVLRAKPLAEREKGWIGRALGAVTFSAYRQQRAQRKAQEGLARERQVRATLAALHGLDALTFPNRGLLDREIGRLVPEAISNQDDIKNKVEELRHIFSLGKNISLWWRGIVRTRPTAELDDITFAREAYKFFPRKMFYKIIAYETRMFIRRHKDILIRHKLETCCLGHAFELKRRLSQIGIEADVFYKIEGREYHAWVITKDGYLIDAYYTTRKARGMPYPPCVLTSKEYIGDQYRNGKHISEWLTIAPQFEVWKEITGLFGYEGYLLSKESSRRVCISSI